MNSSDDGDALEPLTMSPAAHSEFASVHEARRSQPAGATQPSHPLFSSRTANSLRKHTASSSASPVEVWGELGAEEVEDAGCSGRTISRALFPRDGMNGQVCSRNGGCELRRIDRRIG
jgi:hypothetical protein